VLGAKQRCLPSAFSKVLAARKKNLTTACTRKNKHTACMLAKTIQYPYFAQCLALIEITVKYIV